MFYGNQFTDTIWALQIIYFWFSCQAEGVERKGSTRIKFKRKIIFLPKWKRKKIFQCNRKHFSWQTKVRFLTNVEKISKVPELQSYKVEEEKPWCSSCAQWLQYSTRIWKAPVQLLRLLKATGTCTIPPTFLKSLLKSKVVSAPFVGAISVVSN